jgi:anthranilate/para-aminobenzoate synthase component I
MALELDIVAVPGFAGAGESALDLLRRVDQGWGGDYVMLHSAAGDGASVVGFEPLCQVVVDAEGRAEVHGVEGVSVSGVGPLGALEAVVTGVRFAAPHALVGWLGFVSYDVGRFLEQVPARAAEEDELKWPVVWFTLFRHYVVFEGGRATAYKVLPRGEKANAGASEQLREFSGAATRRACVEKANAGASEQLRECAVGGAATIVEQQATTVFEAKVTRVKEYIAAGDIYQANLAQRWVVETPLRPLDVFRRLCGVSPAPYAACVRLHDRYGVRHVVSASPELFLTVGAGGGRGAVTRPIKGTRPRDLHDAARDEALRDELLASAKDHAELTMIVDLLRNDLGRVAEYGSVRVLEARAIEQHPTVWHTVATIAARLRREAGLAEILAAVCPGGSITGAPKIRAMQIIEELEGFRRGMYCGNIGVIGPQGTTMALNIAIRTLVMQAGRVYVYAGGGIVADSLPTPEYEETLHKAAAMMAALGCEISEFKI